MPSSYAPTEAAEKILELEKKLETAERQLEEQKRLVRVLLLAIDGFDKDHARFLESLL